MAAPSHLHSTQYSTSLADPASWGWNVANLVVDTIELQLGESLAAPAGRPGNQRYAVRELQADYQRGCRPHHQPAVRAIQCQHASQSWLQPLVIQAGNRYLAFLRTQTEVGARRLRER
jgi:hypothetical protein